MRLHPPLKCASSELTFPSRVSEPIVLCLSLLSGFSDMLIFVFLDATAPLYAKWSFSVQMTGLSFVVLAAAYLIAYGIHL